MHIPKTAIAQQQILPFADALAASETAEVPYDRAGWLYVPHTYEEYRYILGTKGKKPLITIGVNPSTAAPNALDNTLKSVERIAHGNGFDSFIMFNVYAQRATVPDDMDQERDERLHAENMRAFDWVLSRAGEAPAVWAAWGAIIEKRRYLPDCVRDMLLCGAHYGAVWYTAGARSKKKGHPHHPLYLRSDTQLEPFADVETYLKSLSH